MDAILDEDTQPIFIIENHEVEMSEDPIFHENMALWIKDKDIYRPSTHITIIPELSSGIYTVDYDRDYGFSCKEIKSETDELFVFSDSITSKLLQEINLFWEKKDLYASNNLIHKRGILLEGYPGTGKTSIINQVSESIMKQGGIVFQVTGLKNLELYVQFMQGGFRKIQPDTPIITILEEINQYSEVELALLDFLDGKASLNHHVIIATTNNTEDIPDTFLRPSRIDLTIEINMPTDTIRREYFQFKKIKEPALSELVKETNGCSLADLKEVYICIYLLDYSIDNALTKVKTPKIKKNYMFSPQNKIKIGL